MRDPIEEEILWMTSAQWIQWVAATCIASASLAAYAFTTFDTKEHVQEVFETIDKRLDRIEDKIDRLIEYRQAH